MTLRRVVVTGLGALTPLGNSVASYWEGLIAGRSGADFITRFDATLFKTKFACEVKGFDPTSIIDKKEVRRMDPYLHYALAATDEGVRDAGLIDADIDKDRIGVIWASGIGGLKTFEEEVSFFARGDGTPRFNPFFIPKMISDIAAGTISIRYGYRGLNYATVSACASSTHALIASFDSIRLGRAEIIVAGGSEAAVTASGVGGFNAMKALSERNDSPKTASRPFDLDRDGFVLGEGAGCIIVEEYEHAIKRGAKIYCELAGGGMSADAYHMTAPHPDGLGAQLVMKDALRDSGMTVNDIDYINVHGTSTPLGDPQEIKAIQKIFGDAVYKLNISATKSMTGHLLGAAGAIEAIASILAMQNNIIPPTINHFTDDPAFDPKLNLTFNKAQERNVDVALSNTFGFGGHNASVIFKKL
ncbi:MAG: beta-ketoacyl-ACP synthase II [Bacteroidetes bacterium]|nr:beta-ketoacyl-ACP synthase II [Bacteroidota bacterium]MBP7399110.1 beta-ketoacyl-ACP synthase II [Chitinophagales bacterium]MBK7108642.1 beta-ketoacyl-ACP synthase II [Bacteroidota bacterium]MBK8489034.1 beta-ketoacyl-ACP synthase II [Bacteroidota bacterium]MBK8680883.1 beta-ketoacyl-ACP synthase II [Bacteroidota bacterium]